MDATIMNTNLLASVEVIAWKEAGMLSVWKHTLSF